jgi:ABC-type lipoprotein export system ATPase subunit
MQRVAIARAIIHNPPLLLADEPTGNLDSTNSEHILQIFARLARERGLTVLMATHSPDAAAICDTVLHMHDGRLQAQAAGGHA